MDGLDANRAEYAGSRESVAETPTPELAMGPANGSEELLRDVIGRNVMAWIDSTAQQRKTELQRYRKVKRFQ